VVLALGITWVLGRSRSHAGGLAGRRVEGKVRRCIFSNFGRRDFANSAYLAGAVLGALGFGWLTDRIGRKKNCSSSRWLYI